jgi:hypothetical protein
MDADFSLPLRDSILRPLRSAGSDDTTRPRTRTENYFLVFVAKPSQNGKFLEFYFAEFTIYNRPLAQNFTDTKSIILKICEKDLLLKKVYLHMLSMTQLKTGETELKGN